MIFGLSPSLRRGARGDLSLRLSINKYTLIKTNPPQSPFAKGEVIIK